MTLYRYKGRYAGGEPVTGTFSAADADTLRTGLFESSIIVESYEQTLNFWDRWLLGSIAGKEITRSTRQLASLLSAGLNVAEAVEAVADSAGAGRLAVLFRSVLQRLTEGLHFADALKDYAKVFDESYVALVGAGESAGKLPEIMTRLAEHRERMDDLKRKVATAMAYPTIVVFVSFAVLLAVFKYVIPTFVEMYDSFGAKMPPLTQSVLDVSTWIGAHTGVLAFGTLAILCGSLIFAKRPSGRVFLHKWGLRIPIIGGIWLKTSMARFARTLGLLHSSGVGLLPASKIAVETLGNLYLRRKMEVIGDSLTRGISLRESLQETEVVPNTMLRMIGSGEKSGKLGDMLTAGARYYEKEVEDGLTAVTSVIEPLIILVLGSVVAFILIVMYLPLFDIVNTVGP